MEDLILMEKMKILELDLFQIQHRNLMTKDVDAESLKDVLGKIELTSSDLQYKRPSGNR